jgi:pilus assembly protein CpaE
MRALVIGDQEGVTKTIGEIVLESGLGYHAVNVITLASALGSSGQIYRDLTIVVLPPEVESAVEAMRALRGSTESMILVVGPTTDVKLVLRVLRHGAEEYLDQSDLENELRNSLSRLKSKRPNPAERGRVVGLLSASGGAGASTLAANLAVLLATTHGQTGLIDMRAAVPEQDLLLDLKPAHHLAELCRNVSRLDQNMLEQSFVRHSSGVHLLAAPSGFDEVAQVTPQGVREVLMHARKLFQYVVLDLDRSLRPEQLSGILQADLLYLVLRLDIASLRHARRMLDYLKEVGVAESCVRGVANRYGQPKELPLAKVEQALGIPIAHRIPDDPAEMNQAVNRGIPVVLGRPRAKVSKCLAKLAEDVKKYEGLYRQNGHGTLSFGTPGAATSPPAAKER